MGIPIEYILYIFIREQFIVLTETKREKEKTEHENDSS